MINYILAAEVVAAHGLLGEVRVNVYANGPEVFEGIKEAKFGSDVYKIDRLKYKKNQAVLKIVGFDTVEDATKLVGVKIYIDKNAIKVSNDEFFIVDLIGLSVVDIDTDECYGKISEVVQNPANDIYIVKNNDKEYLIPAVLEIVPKISLEDKTVYIRPIEGLLNDEN